MQDFCSPSTGEVSPPKKDGLLGQNGQKCNKMKDSTFIITKCAAVLCENDVKIMHSEHVKNRICPSCKHQIAINKKENIINPKKENKVTDLFMCDICCKCFQTDTGLFH